jgi:hypothetical protein
MSKENNNGDNSGDIKLSSGEEETLERIKDLLKKEFEDHKKYTKKKNKNKKKKKVPPSLPTSSPSSSPSRPQTNTNTNTNTDSAENSRYPKIGKKTIAAIMTALGTILALVVEIIKLSANCK